METAALLKLIEELEADIRATDIEAAIKRLEGLKAAVNYLIVQRDKIDFTHGEPSAQKPPEKNA